MVWNPENLSALKNQDCTKVSTSGRINRADGIEGNQCLWVTYYQLFPFTPMLALYETCISVHSFLGGKTIKPAPNVANRLIEISCLFTLFLLFLPGCAPNAVLKMTSEPPGARIYRADTGEIVGYAPATYQLGPIPDYTFRHKKWHVRATFAAYKEGYHLEEWSPRLSTKGLSPSMPGPITWNHVFVLEPERVRVGVPPPQPSHQQKRQQKQQTIVIPDVRGEKGLDKGTVIVSSIPQNADVTVDGIFVGNAPFTLPLTEGIHIIEVRLSGYEPYSKEVRVIAGSQVTIRATLKRQ